MEALEHMRTIEDRANSTKHSKKIISKGRAFVQWCLDAGLPWQPARYETVGGFLCAFVLSNKGSAKSVTNVISLVKCWFARHTGLSWMGERDSGRLKLLANRLRYEDVTPIKHRHPVTMNVLLRASRSLGNHGGDLVIDVFMHLAHDGMFRAGELLGLRVNCLSFLPGRVLEIHLCKTKTEQMGPGVKVLVSWREGLCGYSKVLNFMNMFSLWSEPKSYLLPVTNGKAFYFDEPLKAADLKLHLESLFERAGYGDKWITGHSFRAGGATDLFMAGVPFQTIQKQGRWKSDAVLRYFKAEAVDICREVSRGFQSCEQAAKDAQYGDY